MAEERAREQQRRREEARPAEARRAAAKEARWWHAATVDVGAVRRAAGARAYTTQARDTTTNARRRA